MFYFYSSKQTVQNTSYYKGILFEDLLRQFLSASSYEVSDLRRKHRSLEYDIYGQHTIDKRGLICEAKAYEETISGQHVAAFIGKALPYLCSTERGYSALFLSTSALSPDGDDYLRGLEKDTPYRVISICGSELQAKIQERLKLPKQGVISSLCKERIPHQSGQHLLHTDRGTFIVVIGSGEHGVLDDRFCLIDHQGRMVETIDMLNKIKQSIQVLDLLALSV